MDRLPKGWKNVTIEDVCHKITDGTHKTPKYVEDGVPFLSVKNITNGFIDFSDTKFVTQQEHEELIKRCNPEINDVLYTKVGTTGVAKVIDTNKDFSIFVSLALLKPNFDLIESRFFEYLLNSPNSYKQAQSRTRGVANRNLVLKDIKAIDIPLAPLPEQKRIVSKLDALFERIDKSIAFLEENIKQTEHLMASALDVIFKKLEAKSEVYKVSDFADIKGGKRLPKGLKVQEEKTDYPYIRVADFTDYGTVDISSLQYITKEAHEQIKRYIINPEDLYISIAGTIGKTGIIPNELKGANLTENAARFVFKSDFDINNKFIYYFTLSDSFNAQILEATKTVAQPKLALTRLKEVTLPIPNIERQNKAVVQFDILSSKTQAIIKEQNDKLTNLKALKESILDKAFKGEL